MHRADRIRNVALVGHRGSGKTSVNEALLFQAGAVNRLGTVLDGTTASDSDPDVQARHASGHEAYHPPVSGEVSVPADGRASTMYSFHFPGPVEYACHLPGHYQYGMHGIVEVVADEPVG